MAVDTSDSKETLDLWQMTKTHVFEGVTTPSAYGRRLEVLLPEMRIPIAFFSIIMKTKEGKAVC